MDPAERPSVIPPPTVGRIVWVRNPAFEGECPAIVTRSYIGISELYCNVRVFTNTSENPLFLSGVGPQQESSQKWGWRWPPRADGPGVGARDAGLGGGVPGTAPDGASALSQTEPLVRV